MDLIQVVLGSTTSFLMEEMVFEFESKTSGEYSCISLLWRSRAGDFGACENRPEGIGRDSNKFEIPNGLSKY